MDQVVEPAHSLKENPRVEAHTCNGSGALEAANDSFVHPATREQAVERVAPATTRQSDQTFRQLVEVGAAFGPQILPPDDDDRGVNRESLTLAARPDIEAAMVLALRSTMVAKNDFPMHGYLAPDQNLVDTANPPGER